MRIRFILITICIVLLMAAAILFPFPTHPPDNTRMILDHTLGVYIAPPCFEQSGATNNISETDWYGAQATGFEAESECTEQKLQPVHQTLGKKFSIWLGFERSPWDW